MTEKGLEAAIGSSMIRSDSHEKVTGQVRYIDDFKYPDAWHAAIVRAQVSHGILKGISYDPDFDWDQVVVATPEDIPGENTIKVYMMFTDMPLLADKEIMYRGEPVALIAAPTQELAQEAVKHVTVEIEETESIQTIHEIVDQFKVDPSKLFEIDSRIIDKGDTESAIEGAATVVEGEFYTGYQEQLYMEPQGIIAIPRDKGFLVRGSMQCPFYVAHELGVMFDIPYEEVHVEQTMTGGAFGGKEDFPSFIAGYCAVLARKSGKAVKYVMDRNEDILFTPKRHPSWVRYRTGLNEDGTIAGMDIDFIIDAGAYTSVSPVVMYRGILHAAFAYRCDNVNIKGHIYRTNTFPNGAFRGFGAPQAYWALESHTEDLAKAVNMSADDFRLKNCLRKGDIGPTGQHLEVSVGSPGVIEKALSMSDFKAKLERCSHGRPEDKTWYGIGMAFYAHGACFTGDGETRLAGKARVELDWTDEAANKAGFYLRASSTEMGQGAKTVLAQIAADALSVQFDDIIYELPNTHIVPDTGPTCASRTTVVAGHALFMAGQDLKGQLETLASEQLFNGETVKLENRQFVAANGDTKSLEEVLPVLRKNADEVLSATHQFKLPSYIKWDQDNFKGDAYPAYSWACNVAEVEVDADTLEIKLTKFHACFDVGRLINPVLAKGQAEGGLVQAFGYGLLENMAVRNGIYDADRLQTYVIPTTMDIPEMNIDFLECTYDDVQPGAKGMGELVMNGAAPAIGNAIRNAVGCAFDTIPILPETIFEKLNISGEYE